MLDKIKAFFVSAYDYVKRAFGRSRTIFLNVVAAVVILLTENINYLLGVDWDALFKHEVAVLIALGVQVLNIILRVYTSSAVNFGLKEPDEPAVPEAPEAPQAPDAAVNPDVPDGA